MLDDRQEALCDERPTEYDDLRALFLNCTLKPSPAVSHTEGLYGRSHADTALRPPAPGRSWSGST
jgi:hypothetical protein